MDVWRLIDAELDAGAELDAMEWLAALVEKVASAVENAAVGGWLGGDEGWQAVRWSAVEREMKDGCSI